MKKISYFVVGLLLISSFAAIGVSEEAGDNQETINLSFSNLEVVNSIDSYVELEINGAGGVYYSSCKPVLPTQSTVLELPFGAEVTDIDCQVGTITTETLTSKVVPAPTPVMPGIEDSSEAQYLFDETVYNVDELFPNNWYNYHVGVGRNENKEHTTFVNIRAFPARYNPVTNTVKYVDSMQLTVSYTVPENDPFPSTQAYQLVVIAPQKFESKLQKLVNHKNNMGVSTILKTTEDIYNEYSGVDKPEKIKYFIKDALETYDNDYVLLVGGIDSYIFAEPKDDRNQGSKDWHVPIRYANIKETTGGTFDPGLPSDLYYADIYKEGGEFDDWDSNDDGVFAKWDNTPGRDVLDFYPDVYVGRLACRNTLEVSIMVNKIVNYEKSQAGAWYDNMILAGGDSFEAPGNEGEIVCERIANDYMDEFNLIKLYTSNSDQSMWPTSTNMVREFKKGIGQIFLDGHASPFTWTTHPPGDHDTWTEKFWVFDFYKLTNFNKLPTCCVEGCHNSMFNITVWEAIRDKDHNSRHSWCYGSPVPKCWSWWLASKIGGGSLSTIGNTGLGYGAVGEHGDLDEDGITEPDILEKLGGYYFDQYYQVFNEGNDILGDCHSGALNNYITTHPPMDYQADAKTMEQMVLLGDPSLKIGGYSTGNSFRTEIINGAAGILAAPNEEVMFEAESFNAQGTVSYEWDFDNDGITDATGKTASWNWVLPGGYDITMKATDGQGHSDTYETLVVTQMGADKPAVPSGPSNIKAGQEYTYEANVNTQSGYWSNIYYKFSWGDGTESDWLESSTASHSWTNRGSYSVKVKALLTHESKDYFDTEDVKETDWSNPLIVTLPRERSGIFVLLQNFFEKHPNMFPVIQRILGI